MAGRSGSRPQAFPAVATGLGGATGWRREAQFESLPPGPWMNSPSHPASARRATVRKRRRARPRWRFRERRPPGPERELRFHAAILPEEAAAAFAGEHGPGLTGARRGGRRPSGTKTEAGRGVDCPPASAVHHIWQATAAGQAPPGIGLQSDGGAALDLAAILQTSGAGSAVHGGWTHAAAPHLRVVE